MKNNTEKEAGIALAIMFIMLAVMACGGDITNNGLLTLFQK